MGAIRSVIIFGVILHGNLRKVVLRKTPLNFWSRKVKIFVNLSVSGANLKFQAIMAIIA